MVEGPGGGKVWPSLLTGLVGVLVLVAALVVGMWPHTITGGIGEVTCGSAWLPEDAAAYEADRSSVVVVDGRGGHLVACVQRLSAPLVVSVVMAVVGLAVLAGAVRTRLVRGRAAAAR